MYRLRWLGVVSAVILISGCQSLPPAPTPLPVAPTAAPAVQVAPTAQVSPLTVPTAAIDASPVVTPEASALPTVDAQGRRFEIERPVKASDTVIKGTGLPGIPLEVHDVTRMGAQLGGGTVGEDGRFEITVAELTPSVRIGITLVEPDDSIWANPAVLGPQSLVVPMVGAYLDTVLVEP